MCAVADAAFVRIGFYIPNRYQTVLVCFIRISYLIYLLDCEGGGGSCTEKVQGGVGYKVNKASLFKSRMWLV